MNYRLKIVLTESFPSRCSSTCAITNLSFQLWICCSKTVENCLSIFFVINLCSTFTRYRVILTGWPNIFSRVASCRVWISSSILTNPFVWPIDGRLMGGTILKHQSCGSGRCTKIGRKSCMCWVSIMMTLAAGLIGGASFFSPVKSFLRWMMGMSILSLTTY